MQAAVRELVSIGPLPPERFPDVIRLMKFKTALHRVVPPVSAEDAEAMAKLLGPDDCHGIARTLVRLIQTATDATVAPGGLGEA